MVDVEVIDNPAVATAALAPMRGQLLAELGEPASASMLAFRLELPRQKVNYHLRALESHGLVAPVDQRQWGGLTERLVVASAASYVVSPAALGPVAADPARSRDHLSASYLIALASRAVREVGALCKAALQDRKRLATLSIDTTIRFRNATERAAFTEELASAVTALAAHYHDADAPHGRPHRLLVAAYPAPPESGTSQAL